LLQFFQFGIDKIQRLESAPPVLPGAPRRTGHTATTGSA
jgi:hypothetical protein